MHGRRDNLTQKGDNSHIIRVAPGKTPILRCYKCQVSFEVDRDLDEANPALEAFAAAHQPHGQLFVGTNDEHGKFQAMEGPGDFRVGSPREYLHGSNR